MFYSAKIMKLETGQDLFTESINPFTSNLLSNVNSSKPDLFEGLDLKCPFFGPAYEYCCEENCNQNAVICKNDDCKCKANHENCDFFSKAKSFNQKINNKIIDYSNEEYQEIEKNTNKIVDKVSEMLDKITFELKTFGLNENEMIMKDSIIDHFSQNNLTENKSKLNGENLHKFRARQKEKDSEWFEYSIQKYKNIVSETKLAIEPLFEKIEMALTYMHPINKHEKGLKYYMTNSMIIKEIIPMEMDLASFSEIINQNLLISSIKKVYSYKKEKKLFNFPPQDSNPEHEQNIFKKAIKTQKEASKNLSKHEEERLLKENQMREKEFCESIKGKSNLVFLIVANGIKYGSYTPCLFDDSNEWKMDNHKQSFLFKIDSSYYSEKVCFPENSLKFSSKKVEIGSFGSKLGMKENGMVLTLKNGEFYSEIMFASNPNNSIYSQSYSAYIDYNDPILHFDEELVSVLEVYELQVLRKVEEKKTNKKN